MPPESPDAPAPSLQRRRDAAWLAFALGSPLDATELERRLAEAEEQFAGTPVELYRSALATRRVRWMSRKSA